MKKKSPLLLSIFMLALSLVILMPASRDVQAASARTKTKRATAAYKTYIKKGSYKKAMQKESSTTLSLFEYNITDINKDGIPELIISCQESQYSPFYHTRIYTYNYKQKKIKTVKLYDSYNKKYVTQLYGYLPVGYSSKHKSLTICFARPFRTGGSICFYQLKGKSLTTLKSKATLSFENYSGIKTTYKKNNNKISKKTYNSYIKSNKSLKFKKIK